MAEIDFGQLRQALTGSLQLALTTLAFLNVMVVLLITNRLEGLAWLLGALSPMVLAVAIILPLRLLINPFAIGFWLVAFLQAVTMLPLVVNFWQLRLQNISQSERKLMSAYMPKMSTRLTKFWVPTLARDAIEISVIIVVLSIGDLALLPLFRPQDFTTLPLLIWQFMGSYQFSNAYSTTAIMIFIMAAIFVLGSVFKKVLK